MDVAYGTLLHDSKVAQSWVILLRLCQVVTVAFFAYQKGSDQLLSQRLDRPSQASQLIVQIAQLSPSKIRLGMLILLKTFSKCNTSLTDRASTKLRNVYLFGSYEWTRLTRAVKRVR